MLRMLLPISSMLAACTPSPQKAAMPSPSPVLETIAQDPGRISPENPVSTAPSSAAPSSAAQGTGNREHAARAPVSEPISIGGDLAPGRHADLPEAAQGRRIVSTAFVRAGPDGHLTVELRNGHVLVLRDVVMGPKEYCGVQVSGDSGRVRYCGGYGEVAAARPGGAPSPDESDLAVSQPAKPARRAAERK